MTNQSLSPFRIPRPPPLRLDPVLTAEEAIVLRALVSGQTDKQVCRELRLDPGTFLRMMRDIRQKLGAADNLSLIESAKQKIRGADQRLCHSAAPRAPIPIIPPRAAAPLPAVTAPAASSARPLEKPKRRIA
jgi:DNA-binding CsgD family transcriptional regulator